MNKTTLLIASTLVLSSVNAQNSAFSTAKQYFKVQGDTLKMKALDFLENNISEHYSRTYIWQDSTKKTVNLRESEYIDFNEYRKVLKQKKLTPIPKNIQDKDKLSSEDLINIVERGFIAWQKPINNNLNFNDFCNYLLPYRVQNEPLENWYQNFEQKYGHLTKDNASSICNSVNSNLKTWFFSSFSFEDRTELEYCLSPSQMLFRRQGNCQDLCNLSVYVMRMLGLACSVDFTPAWATSSYNHFWCTYIDESGEHRPFEGVTGMSNDFVVYREPSKVFRITYQKQQNTLADKIPLKDIPSNFLKMKNLIDVTTNYWRTSDLPCRIDKTPLNNISYISVFNGFRWFPVDWAEINNGNALFKKISVGAVYLPQNFENGKLICAGNPTLIRSDKSIKELIPDYLKKRTISITEAPKFLYYRPEKKYTLYFWDKKWVRVSTKIADKSKVMTFEDIPSNTLYLLVPEYSEKKERIFTVTENGEIERW